MIDWNAAPDTAFPVVLVDPDIEDLIPGYLDQCRSHLQKLGQLLPTGETGREEMITIGHTFKGNGSAYGLDRISEFGRVIEAAARNRDWPALGKQMVEMQIYLEHLQVQARTTGED